MLCGITNEQNIDLGPQNTYLWPQNTNLFSKNAYLCLWNANLSAQILICDNKLLIWNTLYMKVKFSIFDLKML